LRHVNPQQSISHQINCRMERPDVEV